NLEDQPPGEVYFLIFNLTNNTAKTKKIKSAIGLGLLKSHTADIGKTFGPEEEHPDPNERENKGESRVMRIFAKKDRGEKRDRSEKSQSRLGSSDSDEDDDDDPAAAANLEYAKPDPNFGSNAFVETDKPQTWNVIVRVIEGRDLKAGAMRVRASLEAHQKCTRVCAQDDPSWKQNLVFTLKKMSLQNLAPQSLSIKVTRVKRFSEKVKGEFCCPMGAVIHSTGRAVISKWVALASPFDDEDDDAVMENRGFLKVSIAVYSMNESPPKMSDDADADKEEIWSGAQLEEISLRVRLFRLHQLADEIHQEVETNKGKKPTKFAVEVSVGSEIAMSNAVENSMYNLDDVVMNAVSFNQDLIIPMMWPTVISKIFFRLFICKGKKKRFIGQAFIFMRSIYEPGNKGYMPTFGPSFLNFYGYEHKKKLWRYLARLLVSIGVVEYAGESVQRTFIDHTSLVHSKLFEVSFLVSMGEFGSTGTLLSRNRNSVLGALPDHDDGKYFSMPWGNHKPSTEVPGLWEDVDARLERSNAIMKILKEIDGFKYDETEFFDNMAEKVVRFLQRMRENVLRLAKDDQISLPYVMIKMLASGRVVGYVKVPAQEFPAVVHVRMWFGRRGYDWSWNEYCQPAEMKYYCEIFAYQKKNKLTSNWKEAITYTNENRTEDMSEFKTTCPYGWRYMGNWVVRNTHDMWVCSSDGCPTFVDKVFEVQKWSDGEWHPHQFTDYFGGIIEKERMKDPGEEPGIVENERRPDHKYRRRCIKRVRKAVDFHNQDFNAYQQSLGDTKWEVFLGRFQCTPKVIIATAIDQRAKPRWNTLTFGLGRSSNRFEVPGELRPKFNNYAIQILCWGVRNLKKYQFLSVRQPFLELIIGDMDTRTDRIQNVSKEPNFPTPLITFPMVSLPADLHFSPPIVINLYDTRAFKREPLVGVCHISNLHRYTRVASRKKSDWSKYDQLIETEDNILANTPVAPSLRREDMPELDWWSKYYASLGHPEKAPGFAESGIEYLTIFKVCLEQVGSYNGFMDFLDTFPFVKSSRGNYDDPEEKEKTGELKGKVFITKIPDKCSETVLLDPPGVEFLGTVKCLMRLYLIEATGLVSQRKNGMLDPYVIVRIGKNKVNLKKKYRPDTLDPTFGECIELEVNIPVEKDLKITIMDYRKLIPDDTIGSTRIDLENRLLTKWRATVGLSRQHTIQGEMQWRDQLTPLDALKGYCKKMLVDPPIIIERNGDVGLSILGIEFMYSSVMQELEEWDKAMERASAGSDPKDKSESAEEKEDDKESKKKWRRGDEVLAKRASIAQHGERHRNVELTPEQRLLVRKQARERIIGRPLQQVALHILLKMNLVPEHVETRTLYTEMGGSTPCGELRMFVDLFPLVYGPVPPAIDIKPRDPDKYQLRIALFNVSHAIPVKRSFGTPTSDLYVKVLINGSQKAQTSDVHFRSTDGCGEFNYRFVINIAFNPWERKIVSYNKKRLFRKASEDMVEPFVIIQLWDKNKLRKDVMLGQMVMDLTNFKGKFESADSDPFQRYKKPKDNEVNVINLFDSDTIRGWWPVLTNDYLHRNKDDAALKKKNDDYTADNLYIMGLLELEMSIVTAEEAEADPVGKKRKEPNHSPYLPKPLRSRWNMFFITSR
ncbi:unnamed protein product, partial [Nippostrongylus brasiliensis]|uniref:Sperm vesicle fusion protein fer-1 (inferred by orthology to a C. elegans protein) n=1 Tax=Nippostrongylus brasiliensis TaxID=27835 RepID=A0A0N4Y2S5_NIPBR